MAPSSSPTCAPPCVAPGAPKATGPAAPFAFSEAQVCTILAPLGLSRVQTPDECVTIVATASALATERAARLADEARSAAMLADLLARHTAALANEARAQRASAAPPEPRYARPFELPVLPQFDPDDDAPLHAPMSPLLYPAFGDLLGEADGAPAAPSPTSALAPPPPPPAVEAAAAEPAPPAPNEIAAGEPPAPPPTTAAEGPALRCEICHDPILVCATTEPPGAPTRAQDGVRLSCSGTEAPHSFHAHCLRKWCAISDYRCPLCKRDLADELPPPDVSERAQAAKTRCREALSARHCKRRAVSANGFCSSHLPDALFAREGRLHNEWQERKVARDARRAARRARRATASSAAAAGAAGAAGGDDGDNDASEATEDEVVCDIEACTTRAVDGTDFCLRHSRCTRLVGSERDAELRLAERLQVSSDPDERVQAQLLRAGLDVDPGSADKGARWCGRPSVGMTPDWEHPRCERHQENWLCYVDGCTRTETRPKAGFCAAHAHACVGPGCAVRVAERNSLCDACAAASVRRSERTHKRLRYGA